MKHKLFDKIPESVLDTIEELKEFKMITKAWSGSDHNVDSSSGNTNILSDDIYEFTEYNFLPIEGRTLDGHYTFYVNVKTFEFLVIQSSYYGSLAYTTLSRDSGWADLNEYDLKYAQCKIASKLLGMYHYNGNSINQNGKNLFSDGQVEIANELYSTMRWIDGIKRSLICDYRKYREEYNNAKDKLGHINELEISAIKLLT